jgi:hypothetical protein
MREKNKFTIDQINIGESVYFENEHIENFDLYWKVIGKLENHLHLKINEMGANDTRFIDIKDIIYKHP